MCNSILYAASTISQSLANGGTVNFGNIVRLSGNDIGISGGNIIIHNTGYYRIIADIAFTAAAAGTAVIQLYENGVAIPGATATITTAVDTTYSVSIPAAIRNKCCCDKTVSATITGVAVTILNSAITVDK